MIKKLLYGVSSLMAFSSFSQVVPNIDWIMYKSERAQISNVPSAIDANQNAYITGYMYVTPTNANANTVKYDPTSLELWTNSYDNGGFDNSKAIVIDASGNSYVTGESDGVGTGRDVFVLKIDPNGNQVWCTRYNNATANLNDVGNAIVLDPAGDVFITGYTTNSAGNKDYLSMKLNGVSGAIQFSVTYAGAGNQDDEAVAIGYNNNRLYITGSSVNGSGNSDLVTQRLNPNNGGTIWSKSENGTANNNDYAYALIPYNNDVVVVGQENNTTTNNDYVTIYYHGSNGNNLWKQSYDFLNTDNKATALVADASGNFAVTGIVNNAGVFEYHTILYNTMGTQLWVSKVSTNLPYTNAYPQIAVDPIANHFYVCGQKLGVSSDIFVYQITPGGNKTWEEVINGAQNGPDDAVDLVVTSTGVVYVAGASLNSSAKFDYTTIRISQTPVYFPPDLIANQKPNIDYLFYENKGQITYVDSVKVAKEILFSNIFSYPVSFYSIDKISYKLFKADTIVGGHDTLQRIDVNFIKANKNSQAFPFDPKHGSMSFMQVGLPDAVTGVQGYERYMIPNIYPNIDLHYYSNNNGLKLYYVVKPGGQPSSIEWKITGASLTTLLGTNLEIKGFNSKVVFEKPNVYSVNILNQPVTLTTTASWQNIGQDDYKINISPYNSALPLIVEIDCGTTIASNPTSVNNLVSCTYYGGWWEEGARSVVVDDYTGYYAILAETSTSNDQLAFPVISSSLVSITTQTTAQSSYIAVLLFDKNGNRLAVNTYGVPGLYTTPIGLTLSGYFLTVVGNMENFSGAMPLYNSVSPLTPSTYSNTNGVGYAIQFEYVPVNSNSGSINNVKWATRLNGYACDIDKTPDGKYLYITSSTDHTIAPVDTKTQAGSYNNSLLYLSEASYQISKFDSLGVRKWSTIFLAQNTTHKKYNTYNYMNNVSNNGQQNDVYLKCKINCDKYGFSIGGETDTTNLLTFSKYGAPVVNTFNGRTDAFFARFNKRDSLVYCSYIGGTGDETFTDIDFTSSNKSILTGYCTSSNMNKITTAVGGSDYVDSVNYIHTPKIWIAKFDTIGNKIWSTFYGATTPGFPSIYGWGVVADNKDRVYITGRDLGDLPNPITNPPGVYSNQVFNNSESFMLCFDQTNNPIWNTHFGGRYEDGGTSLAFNPQNNNIILTGITNSPYNRTGWMPYFPITQDPNNPTAYFQPDASSYTLVQTTYDCFIATFNTNAFVGIQEYSLGKNNYPSFILFPNPAQNEASILISDNIKGDILLQVYSLTGQLIVNEERKKNETKTIKINTTGFINGMYLVRISNQGNTYSSKLLITK